MKVINPAIRDIVLTGMYLPWRLDQEQPWLVQIEGQPWLAVYSTIRKLDASMAFLGVTAFSVKLVQDGREFLESLVGQIEVCLDPYPYQGNTRFTRVFLPAEPR